MQLPLPLPHGETFRLERLRDLGILDTSPEQIFDDIVHLAALMCDTPVAFIDFVDEQRAWFKAKIGIELEDIPRAQSFSAHAILQSDVLIVPDPLSDERFKSSFLVNQIGMQFYAGIPIIIDYAHPLGTLAVMDRVPHLLTAEQIDCLQILARRITRELELRRKRETPSPQQGSHVAPLSQRSVTVLIVEDNDNLRNVLHRVLEGDGFSVLAAANSAEALRWCKQNEGRIDLVVSEIVMSGPNGPELSERIRVFHPETKFLFITDFGDVPELRELMKCGATIMEKPFLPSELLHNVENTLNPGKTDIATGTEG